MLSLQISLNTLRCNILMKLYVQDIELKNISTEKIDKYKYREDNII